MIRQVSSLLLLWLAVVSSAPISPQQQQQQLALAAASQQQAQQFQQPYFAAGHGQFAGQRATYAGFQGAPVAYQGAPLHQPRPAPQLAPQQVAYQQQIPQPGSRKAPRPINPNAPQQPLQEEDYDPNPAYNFSFDVKDDTFTNYQNRKEQREGDKITGSYSVVDSDGFIRTVTYTADPLQGFKAEVVREPTDIVVKLPTPHTPPAGLPVGGYTPQPAPQQPRQPQYISAGPAPSLRQHQPAPQPQYLSQAVPQQQQQALALARQAQLQQSLQAYRPSSGKAALGGAPRVGVPVAGGILYQPQQQLQHQQAAYPQ